jgi:hypothetical protein
MVLLVERNHHHAQHKKNRQPLFSHFYR